MTRRLIITLITILTLTETHGQSYSYEKIIETADSIVNSNLDKHLLKYLTRDSGGLKYEFKRDKWRKYKTRYGQIGKSETTKGNFQRTYIYYAFSYKEPLINNPLHLGYLPGSIFITFDSNLNLEEQLDLSSIPKYVKEQRPCDFITMEKAIQISKEEKIKDGLEPLEAILDYNGGEKKYCWEVSSVLTKEAHDDHFHGSADTVTIDAVTGRVLSHMITPYGAVY